jgi:hypothetical protein
VLENEVVTGGCGAQKRRSLFHATFAKKCRIRNDGAAVMILDSAGNPKPRHAVSGTATYLNFKNLTPKQTPQLLSAAANSKQE